MKHADELTQLILFLKACRTCRDLHRLRVAENVQELLRAALAKSDVPTQEPWTLNSLEESCTSKGVSSQVF